MRKKWKFMITVFLLTMGYQSCFYSDAKCQDTGKTEYVNLSSRGELKINEVIVNSDRIGLYEKFEISFNLDGEWDNAFDPDQIKVDAHFYSPDGKQIIVPGFFYQEYRQNINNRLEKVGNPIWKVRFTPVLEGEYKYELVANNKGKEIISPSNVFTSISYNTNHGFLRISKTNPLYFEFDDGSPFFGIAMDNASNRDYNRLYNRFAKAGGNFNRLFINNNIYDIGEVIQPSAGPDKGLGKMNLDNSWRLDKVIEIAENLGIYQLLCLTNQTNFNGGWKTNVFNKANGGILDSPREYFTSDLAMKYLEKRFRYIVARWGYSTSVFSWNLWNEYSAQPGFDIPAAVLWHKRMARYLSTVDAFRHVIHTNDGLLNGTNEISSLPETELVSTNTYGLKNIADVADIWTKRMTDQFKKPYILTEFGIGHNNLPLGGYAGIDPDRIMIHDGLWSPLMSGSASTGMAWEGNWVDNQQVYNYINAVSKIVDGIPFNKRHWRSVIVSSFKFKNPQTSYYADVIVEGWNPTGNYGMPDKAAEQNVFQIDKDGRVEANELLHALLADTIGKKKSGNTSSVTFKAVYPVNGEFVVFVSDLRNAKPTIQLKVTLDGKQAIKKDLLPAPFIQNFTINIPKGIHTIQVENSGGGNFVTSFELKNYILRNGSDLEVRGLQSDDYILLWLKNQKFTLLHEMTKTGLQPQPEGKLELQDVPEGSWMVEWVNTIDASYIKTELVESRKQKLLLKTPVIEKSVAVRLHKISDF